MKLFYALLFTVADALSHETSSLLVSTTSGHVHGHVNKTAPDVRQFRGIPFAHPPVGELRWMPPVPLPKSAANNQINATSYGPNCPQYLGSSPTVWMVDTPQFNTENNLGEDCLSISVYAPLRPRRGKLPVIIWMYGGGLIGGGQDTLYYEPSQWIQRTQEHIVVAMNYRVSILGFPNAAGLTDQNLGFMDQRLAVEWTRDNIQAFGGDPTRMGLWGQSAGGASVDWYNYAHYKDPIVSNLMMDSGTALLPGSTGTSGNFSYVAAQVGCGGKNPSDELACMRKVNAQRLSDVIGTSNETLVFYATYDEKLYFSNYTDRATRGLMADIPAIIGNTWEEGNALAPFHYDGVNQTLSISETMQNFVCPATETIRLRRAIGRKSFRYIYSGNFTNESPRAWEGAYHCTELPLLFGTFEQYNAPPTDLMRATSRALQDAWLAFVRDGPDGLERGGWSEYELHSNKARNFGLNVPMQNFNLSSLEVQCDGASFLYYVDGTAGRYGST